jgi:ribonuclease HII
MTEWQIEGEYLTQGIRLIAGVDEVGRGPLAGPVVCAAVIMPYEEEKRIAGIGDSKKISAKKREVLAEKIKQTALAYCIAEVDEQTIDEINILQATRLCMKRAVEGLAISPEFVLTDGNMTLDIAYPQRDIVKGDALVYAIGAASILAKTYRDELMRRYAQSYPWYGFDRNAGYGTAEHIRAIREVGICEIHRKTFVQKFWDGRAKTSPVNT